MKWYADDGARRARQIAGDLLFVLWIVLWIWVAITVYDRTAGLADIGHRMQDAGTRLHDNLQLAGDRLQELPAVGETIADPFERGATAAGDLAIAGERIVESTTGVAFWLRLAIGVSPIAILAGFYLPYRIRFARRAGSARAYLRATPDLELFALRALHTQPMQKIAAISPDPVASWQKRDPAVLVRLAELEIRACGLDPQRAGGAAGGPGHGAPAAWSVPVPPVERR